MPQGKITDHVKFNKQKIDRRMKAVKKSKSSKKNKIVKQKKSEKLKIRL